VSDQGGQGREKRNLGRGLAALFGDEMQDFAELDRVRASRKVPVGQLRPGRFQPRRRFDQEELQSLVDSVRQKGVLQPLLVRRVPGEADQFEIIAGERRWRAAQMAQIHDVPVVISPLTDQEALEVALVENIQRTDLTPLEEAEGFQRLITEFAHTQDNLAQAIGKSRSHVANMLRLLNLPDAIKAMLDDGQLTAGHARALLNAKDPVAIAKEVVARELNVRETERLVQAERPAKPPKAKGEAPKPAASMAPGMAGEAGEKDADTRALERDLSLLLGLKVVIDLKGEAGNVSIHFESLEQLDDILRRLKREPLLGADGAA
jgi:ParB family chromosome partitioning protein